MAKARAGATSVAKARAEIVAVAMKEQAARATSPATEEEMIAQKESAADTAVREPTRRRQRQGKPACWEAKSVARAG